MSLAMIPTCILQRLQLHLHSLCNPVHVSNIQYIVHCLYSVYIQRVRSQLNVSVKRFANPSLPPSLPPSLSFSLPPPPSPLPSPQGLDSGFQGGEDDMYTVYDKPWRAGGGAAEKIYRPSKNTDKDVYGDDVEKLIKTNKYALISDGTLSIPIYIHVYIVSVCGFVCVHVKL